MPDAPSTARARARVALTEDIKDAARRHLAENGADRLSLRAVARDVGLVSSAVYRYFGSRDELLTALIIDSYDALGVAAEASAASSRGRPLDRRWTDLATTVRGWARARPHDYALLYGSPVAGYRAPPDTVAPATRVSRAAVSIVADAHAAGEVEASASARLPRPVRADMTRVAAALEVDLPPEVVARALYAWTQMLGHVSFELFGHLVGAVEDLDGFFAHQAACSIRVLHG